MVPLWLWVLGRRPLEGLCHPYCIISRVHTINIIVDLDITWLRSCCQISPLSSYFPSTFLCYTLWKEVTSCSPLRGELCSISLKAVYLYTLFGIILHGIFGLSLLWEVNQGFRVSMWVLFGIKATWRRPLEAWTLISWSLNSVWKADMRQCS